MIELNQQDNSRAARQWWQSPWSYRESIAVVLGFLLVGVVLQISIGAFDYDIIRFPMNIVVLCAILFVVLLFSLKPQRAFFQWLSGVPLSVSILGVMLLLTLIMGLTIQAPASQHGHHLLGFDAMTRSWPFVLLYLLLLVNLSCVTMRRLLRFSWRDYAFYLNHLGLLVLLVAAGLGASDLRRYVMHVEEGATEWRVYSETGEVLELPLAIKLNDFRLEEYAPSLAVNDRHSLVMTRPEPRLFQSDIVVYTKDEKAIAFVLEVNKPMRVGPWMLYQYGYDNDRGKASAYSSFELVYDPWMPAVYVGIILFMLGSLFLLWEGNKKVKIKRNGQLG